jgi:type VI protein secretion system component VasK
MGMGFVELMLLGSILVIMIAIVIVIVALVRRALSPRRTPVAPLSQASAQPEARSVAAQLGEADQLLDQGHISRAEHASLRAQLLGIERSPDE